MQEAIRQKFHRYLKDNYPDLVLQLQEEKGLFAYLNEAVYSVEDLMEDLLHGNPPTGDAEQRCLDVLINALPPSKYGCLKDVLETEFSERFTQLSTCGLLTTELMNLIMYCDPVFEGLGFSEENQYLRYAIIGTVSEYFEQQEEVKEV